MMRVFSSGSFSKQLQCVNPLLLHRYKSASGAATSTVAWLGKEEEEGDGDAIYKNWIQGTFCSSQSKDFTVVRNPATQEWVGKVPETTPDELQRAVDAAKAAFPEWSRVPLPQRQRIMMDYRNLIVKNMDPLIHWIALENGKTLADARGDVIRGLEVVETTCNMADKLLGDSLSGIANTMDCVSYKVPLGVCAGIAPFNFPAMIPLWMFPVACTAGNTYIMKPTEKAPSATLLLAQLAHEAGLPEGVLNVVHGSHDVVNALCDAPEIRAISFVGSDAAGRHIFQRGTSHGKRVQANLAAKNHAVLLPDANRETTIRALVGAAFGAAGQRCMALSVVILVGSATQSWLPDLAEAASKLRVGPATQEGVDLGPLITRESKQRVESILEQAVEQGGTLYLDGRNIQVEGYPDGNFMGPTILQVDNLDNIGYTEEIFGPVLVVLRADSLDEAIRMVNSNPQGNGCALFTQSGAAARKFQFDVEVGQVGINVPIPVPMPMFSFTGNKGSIQGDLHFYGKQGVQFYTQTKTVISNWPHQKGTELGGVTIPTFGKE